MLFGLMSKVTTLVYFIRTVVGYIIPIVKPKLKKEFLKLKAEAKDELAKIDAKLDKLKDKVNDLKPEVKAELKELEVKAKKLRDKIDAEVDDAIDDLKREFEELKGKAEKVFSSEKLGKIADEIEGFFGKIKAAIKKVVNKLKGKL